MPQDKVSVEEICKRLKPIFGNKIDAIYLKYRLADSLDVKIEIERGLNALYHKHLEYLMELLL